MWANEPEMAKKWSDEEKQAKRKEGKTLKITKSRLQEIIREELQLLNEEKTIMLNPGHDFSIHWRVDDWLPTRDGIALRYDKIKDAFVGTYKGKPWVLHNHPGEQGELYAMAFEKMFGKAPVVGDRRPERGAEVSPDELGGVRLALGNGDVYMISSDVSVGPDGKRYETDSEEFRAVLTAAGPGKNVGAFQDLINGPQAGGIWNILKRN